MDREAGAEVPTGERETETGSVPDNMPCDAAELQTNSIPGVIDVLGKLPAGTIITEAALAKILRRHPVSIKRAVQRGELPPAVRLLGGPVWLAGSIIAHIQKRLDTTAQEAERERRRLESHRP